MLVCLCVYVCDLVVFLSALSRVFDSLFAMCDMDVHHCLWMHTAVCVCKCACFPIQESSVP